MKCKVILNNEAVTVFVYDGVKVQIPAIHKNAEYINVIKKDGKYMVVPDDYVEPTIEEVAKPKKRNKKTTK